MATNSERSFNEALCRVLWTKHPLWRGRMAAQQHRAVKGGGMPDLIVRDPLAAPVALETEYVPARTVEDDAVARLGASLTDSGNILEQSIAVRVPSALQTVAQPDLEAAAAGATYRFCLFSRAEGGGHERWPRRGWLTGGVDNLADLIENAAISERVVARSLDTLETGVREAATRLRDADLPTVEARIAEEPAGHGNAGLASNFLDLAHAKVKPGGVLALVMPLSLLQGGARAASRALLRTQYERTTVIGLAAPGRDDQKSFSADTGMGEVLVVARRRRRSRAAARRPVDSPVTFVALRKRPASGAEAAALATAIRDGAPHNETRVVLGDDLYGVLTHGTWDDGKCASIVHADVVDTAQGLLAGKLKLPQPRTHMQSQYDVWKTATRLHFNRDFRLNSQSLAACLTPSSALGGRAWPNFLMKNRRDETATVLWANTTLGLILFWWFGTTQQAGRSNLTISRLPNLPALDPRTMSDAQHARAQDTFEDFRGRPFLPANEAYRDPTRHALDEAVLVELLGLPRTVLDPLALSVLSGARNPPCTAARPRGRDPAAKTSAHVASERSAEPSGFR